MSKFFKVVKALFYGWCVVNIVWWQGMVDTPNVIQMAAVELATIRWLLVMGVGHVVIGIMEKDEKK